MQSGPSTNLTVVIKLSHNSRPRHVALLSHTHILFADLTWWRNLGRLLRTEGAISYRDAI